MHSVISANAPRCSDLGDISRGCQYLLHLEKQKNRSRFVLANKGPFADGCTVTFPDERAQKRYGLIRICRLQLVRATSWRSFSWTVIAMRLVCVVRFAGLLSPACFSSCSQVELLSARWMQVR